jgi:predicted RNA-binding protein with PUA-like domain
MARWLLKTEPGTYSYDDLARDGRTTWDGVSNPTALSHLRAMKKGDEVLVYHTGAEKAVVGTAAVASEPYRDPKSSDDRLVVVDLTVGRKLDTPVTLAQIKADTAFAAWELVRISRLSVMPVPDAVWKRLQALAGGASRPQASKPR